MAEMGTGAPIWFVCPVARRTRRWPNPYPPGHTVQRTGRVRPNYSHRRTQRTLGQEHEYVCACGHRSWSRVADILRHPLEPGAEQMRITTTGRTNE